MFKRICLITAVSLCVLLGSFSVLNLSSNEGRAERVNDGKHEVTGEKIDKKASMSWIEGERNPHSLDAADGDPVDALYVDDHGKIGIGTISPTEKLTVIGTIESTSGGIKFPDGTIQTTASAPTSGWEKVGEVVLSMDTQSVDFSSIPSGYRLFRLFGNLRIASPCTRVALRFNGDTGPNYDSQVLIANGTNVSASRWTGWTRLEIENLSFGNSTEGDAPRAFNAVITNEPDFVKLVQAQLSVDPNWGAGVYMVYESTAGRWDNAVDEINQITILDGANSIPGLRTGSRFVLYGSR